MTCEDCGGQISVQTAKVQEKVAEILEERYGSAIPVLNSEELLELYEEAICEIFG